jgi:hypothetical protein
MEDISIWKEILKYRRERKGQLQKNNDPKIQTTINL